MSGSEFVVKGSGSKLCIYCDTTRPRGSQHDSEIGCVFLRQIDALAAHGRNHGRLCVVGQRLCFQSHAVLRSKAEVMDDHFDRAPGAGRSRNIATEPGLVGSVGEIETKSALFNQREPLRQPRTAPHFADNNVAAANDIGAGGRKAVKSLANHIDSRNTSANSCLRNPLHAHRQRLAHIVFYVSENFCAYR